MANIKEEFVEFTRKQEAADRRVGLDRWQTLFHCPFSYWADAKTMKIAIHVPLVKAGVKPLELYRPSWQPLIHGGKAYHFKPTEMYLAVGDDKKTLMEVHKSEMEECTFIDKNYFCTGGHVMAGNDSSSCLVNLWKEDWDKAKKTCQMDMVETTGTEAWKLNRTYFAVHAKQPTLFLVTCPNMNIKSKTIQGYQLVWLQEGCQASSREIQLVAGQHGEENEEVTRTVFVSNVSSFVDQK